MLLGLLAGLPALSIDLSSPTLVQLPAALGTTTFVAGLTLSLFMAGFAGGLMAAGRISDRIGRRPVLLASLATYSLAGVACALSTSGPELTAARCVQGFGAGGCSVLAYAMVQDLFEGEAARRKRSYITVVLGIAPIIAPALGVWLGEVAGWRSVHVVLIFGGVLLLMGVTKWVTESRATSAQALRPTSRGVQVWKDRRFLSIAIVNGLSYGALFAYVAGAPVVTIGQMGLAPVTYAALFGCTAISLSAGAWTSARLGRGRSAEQLIWPALVGQAVAGLLILAPGDLAAHAALLLTPPLLFSAFVRGLSSPNIVHVAMGARRSDAGLASAVLGVVQLLSGALSSAVVAALLPHWHVMAVTLPMALLSTAAALLWFSLGLRPRSPRREAAGR